MTSRVTAFVLLLLISLTSTFAQTQSSLESPAIKISVPQKDKKAFKATTPVDDFVRTRSEPGGEWNNFAWRSDFLGKQVQAEGIAWREGGGQRVLLDRSQIRVEEGTFSDKDLGRLVRVVGKLKYRDALWSRFGTYPAFFFIEADSYTVVDRISTPALRAVN